MSYRLGVDVGGTFTDLLLMDGTGTTTIRAKVSSTPDDPSRAVLAGIKKICALRDIEPAEIGIFMHGTTVATNAVLEGKGARVGLITTEGFRFILQIARSHIPGGLGGWITHPKPEPLAPLELTIEVPERIDRSGKVLVPLDEEALRQRLPRLRERQVEAVTVALFNAFVDGRHESRVREIVEEELPGVPVSISSEVMPEMLEYERAQTTVVNSYVRPIVSRYLSNLKRDLIGHGIDAQIHILRSDGGLASVDNAIALPVNLLMSGPAGGVAGAVWFARHAGYSNVLTLDMGGTSTDVALIENGMPRIRRETSVGDVTVKVAALDIHTVGAGGGSIAHVPKLTGALRVGPESAGAVPGPALYGKGGKQPTVTDANAVLGYLPNVLFAGELRLDYAAAAGAVGLIADAMSLPVETAAAGIVDITNETMLGALRLVSVQQGYDPRDFALMAFGGAGPLHANALGRLLQTWPVIIPPSPGVLCAYGDATTQMRNEASRTLVQKFDATTGGLVAAQLLALAAAAAIALDEAGVSPAEQSTRFEVDCRYDGQGLTLAVPVDIDDLCASGLSSVADAFDSQHRKLFTFQLDGGHELINLRAIVEGAAAQLEPPLLPAAEDVDPAIAQLGESIIQADGEAHLAIVYDRKLLAAGHVVPGPAIIVEMDSTTLILPSHLGIVDKTGCIIIRPMSQ